MGAAAQAAMAGAKPGANPQGKGFYQGNIGGFLSNNTAENERWMRQNAKTGAFTWNPQANAYVRKEGPGIVSLWRADGYQLKTGVKDQGLWDFANARGKPTATPAPSPNTPLAPAPPSTPGPVPGPPGGPTSTDDITLGGTGQPDQKWDPTPWDPYSTGTPITPAAPPPTTGGGFLAPPNSTKPQEAAQALFGGYKDSTGLDRPKTGPSVANMGGTGQGGMAAQPASAPQVATVGAAEGPMGRPSSAPIAGLPQMPQNQAIKPAQPQTQPNAGGPENAAPAPVGPDPRQMYGQQVAKARAAYGAWPMADDPKSPQPKFTPGKSFYNAFTGMWGRA